jgi:hypothetical protein
MLDASLAVIKPPAEMSTLSSTSGLRAAGAKKMAYPKSDINVNLKDHYNSKVFTSSSPVTGDVTITTKREVPFDSIQIILLGTTKTTFDGMGAPQSVTHTFLKMLMPIPESTYAAPRVLMPGQTYTIPFNFVIPNQLTINACNHERLSDQVQDHHVLLPPSLGGWERDDMGPVMAQVDYTIKARVLRDDVVEGVTKRTRIMEATQTIKVLPATAEEPPLNITDKDKIYRMSKTKTLRKNLLSTKLGRLTAEAIQPGPAVLSADSRRVMAHPMAHINLTFSPESSRTLPPTITGVSAKLTAHTYFSSGTISTFPNLNAWQQQPYVLDRRGYFSTSTPLPAITLAEQPAWTTPAAAAAAISRRDSGYGGTTDDEDEPTPTEHDFLNKNNNKPTSTITTTVAIPLTLPTAKKTLVPTFHSCIASRVYTLQLTLHMSVKGAANTVSLIVPLQIGVEGSAQLQQQGYSSSSASPSYEAGVVVPGPMGLPTFEEAAADAHLRPRVLRMPVEGGDGYYGEEGGGGGGGFVSGGSAAFVLGEEVLPGYGEPGYRRRA